MYEKLSPDRKTLKNALGVVNYDDPLLKKVPFIHDVVWFSMHNTDADYYAEKIVEEDGLISFDVVEENGGHTPVCIRAFGVVSIYNVLSAFAVGVHLGINMRTLTMESISETRCIWDYKNVGDIL